MAFGDFSTFAESLGQSTNDTLAFVQKVRLTTPVVDAGDYRIGWNFTWGNESAADDTIVEIDQDEGTILYRMQAEPKDSGTDQQYPGAGFAQVTLTAGVHTFDMDFATSDAGEEARIAQARLEFWRVD